jgi:hypothetical protein
MVMRTRFYVVAGIAGAILGQFVAAGVAAGLTWAAPAARELARDAAPLYSGGFMLIGMGLGAWGAVLLLRRWARRERARRGRVAARARVRARGSRTPRPSFAGPCGAAGATRRLPCDAGRRSAGGPQARGRPPT